MNNFPLFPIYKDTAHPHHTCSYAFTQNYTHGITPLMLRQAYSFYLPETQTPPSIAIISAFDNSKIIDSMKCFCDTFALDVPRMQIHYPLGKTDIVSQRWVTESCLDTQWAHVFSPLSDIHTVFSTDDNIDNLIACAVFASTELRADVICMCFGLREQYDFEKYLKVFENLQGIFVASSGDSGGIVSFPSTLPFCVSVGGTNLNITKGGRKTEQTAWSFGGGGKSSLFEIPRFQQLFSPIKEMSQEKRATPDLSFFADGKEKCAVCTNPVNGFTTVGGTSLSCACMSGILALIKSVFTNIDTTQKMLSYLYDKAGRLQYDFPQYKFTDITVGTNGTFFAKEGWDFCTGLGTPVIKQLLI